MKSLLNGNLTIVTFFPLIRIPLIVILSLLYKDTEEPMKIGTLVVSITTYEPDPEEWIGCRIRR